MAVALSFCVAAGAATPAIALPPQDGEGDGALGTKRLPLDDGMVWRYGDQVTQHGINCINGKPESMVESYVSYRGLEEGTPPAVGDTFLARVHLKVAGNPCPSGNTQVGVTLQLPPDVSFAITAAARIRCTYLSPTGAAEAITDPSRCPATPTIEADGHGLGIRALPKGSRFVIEVPLTASRVLTGAGGDLLTALVTPSTLVSPAIAAPLVRVPGGVMTEPTAREPLTTGQTVTAIAQQFASCLKTKTLC